MPATGRVVDPVAGATKPDELPNVARQSEQSSTVGLPLHRCPSTRRNKAGCSGRALDTDADAICGHPYQSLGYRGR